MRVEEELILAETLLRLEELEKLIDKAFYTEMSNKATIACPECGGTNVQVVGTTAKRVKFVCKHCGREFQKSKTVIEEDRHDRALESDGNF